MKTPLAQLIPLLARGLAPTAAIASGLLSLQALGAQGDLDPTFGDVGRVGPMIDFDGPAWSLLPQDDNEILFAGGDFDATCVGSLCDFGFDVHFNHFIFDASGFVGELSSSGLLDMRSDGGVLLNTQVLDVVKQPDGKVIAVGRTAISDGRRQTPDTSTLTVFRLSRDGSLDPTFGVAGVFRLATSQDDYHMGTSVALGPDGSIVVAGVRLPGQEPIVLRLLETGALDNAFGVSGVFIGGNSAGQGRVADIRVYVVLTGGGYRITQSRPGTETLVIALTADGTLDNDFGVSGVTSLETPSGDPLLGNSMVAQSDGRLLVVGTAGGQGFAVRLLRDGRRDRSFSTNAVTGAMTDATAVVRDDNGSILVAGRGPAGAPGALIMRLQANGELDALFGRDGSTWIDLPSDHPSDPVIRDLTVLPDGRVLAAGGDDGTLPPHPFVIRLLGDVGGESPGVLGVADRVIAVKEQSHKAVVTVRRMGGDSGQVSVSYQTAAGDPIPATGGQDYTQVAGRLTWEDRDIREQQIEVPIASNDSSPEDHESFRVVLGDVQGGVGLGTRNATVDILADGGDPAGQFAIETQGPVVDEADGPASVLVHRIDYFKGEVSVTLTPIGGTATAGDDFDPQPVTVSWTDGDSASKVMSILIRNDATAEPFEAFTVELSNPTGGAIVGPRSSATITIWASDQPTPPPPSGSSGGGGFGFLSLLLLAAARFLRPPWVAESGGRLKREA